MNMMAKSSEGKNAAYYDIDEDDSMYYGEIKDGVYNGKYGDSKIDFTNLDELQDLISEIMCTDGPDGHTDGSNIIAKLIWKAVQDREKENQS